MRQHLARRRRWRLLPSAAPQPRPNHQRAQLAVAVALRDGRLERGPCEVCQALEDVEAIHDDLTRPLDVRWHCPAHMQGHQ